MDFCRTLSKTLAMVWFLAVIAAIVAVVIATRTPVQPSSTSTMTVEKPRLSPAPVIPVAQGHVGINAFPWANVRSIRNLDSGATVELQSPLVTPAPIDLTPGRYEITLSNPAYQQPITETVDVRPNAQAVVTARFADPAQATLPRFEAQR